jgi:ABC-type uncharacterized transport system substrate-binding protein
MIAVGGPHFAIDRLVLCFALFALLFALCVPAEAQQGNKVPRIGYLSAPPLSASAARNEAFRQGLRELGYVEGKNIVIEWRSAEGKSERLPALVAELVRLKVDIIVTGGGAATRAAKEASATIPIVTAQDPDPVGNGFVVSLARPGGNITGLSTYAPELSGKRLEILRQVVPRLSRVAVFGTSTQPGYAQVLREIEPTAKAFGVKLQYLDVLESKDIETAFRTASTGRADGVLTLNSAVLSSRRTQLINLAVKEPAARNIPPGPVCRRRGGYVLRCESSRLRPALRYVRGQDFERRQARRSPCGTAEEV